MAPSHVGLLAEGRDASCVSAQSENSRGRWRKKRDGKLLWCRKTRRAWTYPDHLVWKMPIWFCWRGCKHELQRRRISTIIDAGTATLSLFRMALLVCHVPTFNNRTRQWHLPSSALPIALIDDWSSHFLSFRLLITIDGWIGRKVIASGRKSCERWNGRWNLKLSYQWKCNPDGASLPWYGSMIASLHLEMMIKRAFSPWIRNE